MAQRPRYAKVMMRRASPRWMRAVTVIALFACDRAARSPSPTDTLGSTAPTATTLDPCTASSADGSVEPDSTLTLNDEDYPCRLSFRETAVVLRGDANGPAPYPGRYVARDSRGRFITSIAGDNSRVAIWNPDGSFNRTLGEPGQGPGEIPAAGFEPVVFIDSRDWLYVRTGGQQWTIFNADYEYVRRVAIPSRGQFGSNLVFAPGRILVSVPGEVRATHYFRLYGADGDLASQFAQIPPDNRMSSYARMVTPASDTTFWASPDAAGSDSYALELWSMSGTKLSEVRRPIGWFSSGAPSPTRPAKRPTLVPVNVDANGRLLVYSWTGQNTGSPEVHLELIDVRRGAVLASEVVDVPSIMGGPTPRYFFPGTSMGYRYDESAETPVVRIVEYSLTRR